MAGLFRDTRYSYSGLYRRVAEAGDRGPIYAYFFSFFFFTSYPNCNKWEFLFCGFIKYFY